MQSGVGYTWRHNIYQTTNKPYAPTVSICQHITKKTPEIMYLNLRKAFVIRVMAILPNSRPSTRWRRGYLTNNCIKEIFDVGELRYSRTATIKLWRQHLGAQLPETLPQPLNVRRHQEKCFESFRIIYIGELGFFLLLVPFVALVRYPDVDFWLFSSQISLKKFRITRVFWNHSDGFVTRTLFLVPPVI